MSSGHKRGRGHEEEHEEHENHERWLVSYADMVTIVMVLFIVLFSLSQVDQKKYVAFKTGLTAGFGAPVDILSGGDALLDPGGSVAPAVVNLSGSAPGGARNPETERSLDVVPEKVAELTRATERAQVRQEVERLKKAREALEKALKEANLDKSATFRYDERGLVVTIATDDVLFANGSAELQARGRRILHTLGPTLRKLPNRLSIDGHTNSIPISTSQFPSNWELSSSRANGVLRYLHDRDGLPFERMSSAGFADTRPLLPKNNRRALAVNRRVEIVVLATVDNSAGRAVAEIGNGTAKTNAAADAEAATAAAKKAAEAATKKAETARAEAAAAAVTARRKAAEAEAAEAAARNTGTG